MKIEYCTCKIETITRNRRDRPYCTECGKFIKGLPDPFDKSSFMGAYCETFCIHSDDCDRIDCAAFN